MDLRKSRALLASTSVLCLLSAGHAFAQDEGATVEEIVVTATRQEQNLSKVPLSVAAYTQEKLDKQSIRNFQDVARVTPGVTFSRGARGNASGSSLSIRGISSGSGTATVGVYIDDTPIQQRPGNPYSASNAYPKIFDLARVEILRGPQGTLFGVGSEGGTIRFITPDPSLDSYKVYARTEMAFTQSGDPSFEGGVAVGVGVGLVFGPPQSCVGTAVVRSAQYAPPAPTPTRIASVFGKRWREPSALIASNTTGTQPLPVNERLAPYVP